jgi:hypothetical protein
MLVAMAKRPQRAIPEVPKAIFEQFLNELKKDATLRDVAARLKPVLLDNETLSEAAIKAALLPDDTDVATS